MARLSTCVAELSGARTDCEEGVTSNRFLYALAVFLCRTLVTIMKTAIMCFVCSAVTRCEVCHVQCLLHSNMLCLQPRHGLTACVPDRVFFGFFFFGGCAAAVLSKTKRAQRRRLRRWLQQRCAAIHEQSGLSGAGCGMCLRCIVPRRFARMKR